MTSVPGIGVVFAFAQRFAFEFESIGVDAVRHPELDGLFFRIVRRVPQGAHGKA